MIQKKQEQFDLGELQVIERMIMVFDNLVADDEPQARIELQRTMALIFAKPKPSNFIRQMREKAGQYAEKL